jgi:hypothetical protein
MLRESEIRISENEFNKTYEKVGKLSGLNAFNESKEMLGFAKDTFLLPELKLNSPTGSIKYENPP